VRKSNRGRGPNWRRLYLEGEERETRLKTAKVIVSTLKVPLSSLKSLSLVDLNRRVRVAESRVTTKRCARSNS